MEKSGREKTNKNKNKTSAQEPDAWACEGSRNMQAHPPRLQAEKGPFVLPRG